MTYLGIDISKTYFDADFGTAGVKRFDNNARGISTFLATVDRTSKCVLEATGPYSWSLAVAIHTAGMFVAMANPLQVRRFVQSCFQRTKTDPIDAKMLTLFGERMQPRAFIPPEAFVIRLRQLLAVQESHIAQRTVLTNQREALSHMPVIDPTALRILRHAVRAIDKTLCDLAAAMDALIAEHCKGLFEDIRSIPGVGPATARQVIALAGDWGRFETAKAFVAYAGLSPRIYRSGTSVHGSTGIVKLGNPRFRSALYMCSLSAIRCNKGCRELYERLRAKGKHKMTALVAVMQKLARQIWAVATQHTRFDETKTGARGTRCAA